MTAKIVEAVFFAKYTISNFKALYGRFPADGYTKNFFQVAASGGDILGEVLSIPKVAGTRELIEYVWPNGGSASDGKLEFGGRWHLGWRANNRPLPWTISATPGPDQGIPGNPAHVDTAAADNEYSSIQSSNIEPWLIAIKLVGDARRLHVRTYFKNPPGGMADRALILLPKAVQDGIAALGAREGSDAVKFPKVAAQSVTESVRAKKVVDEVRSALARGDNVLLVGPPGTGKSVALDDLRGLYQNPARGTVLFDPDVWYGNWSETTEPESRSELLIFHPSYGYENFVAGLYPKSNASGGMSLVGRPGPLLYLSHWVGDSDRKALLLLDEFNRGQAAAIFGDTLALLDSDKRSNGRGTGASIPRPYAGELMEVPTSYSQTSGATNETISEQVRLPKSLHIVAAMNSTDRSVAPLDAAMRRRFAVIRVGPDYEVLQTHLGVTAAQVAQPLPPTDDITAWPLESVSSLGVQILEALNKRIEFCLGEDFLLGHALLWGMNSETSAARFNELVHAFDTRLVSTLKMTFIDQDEALAAILGVPEAVQFAPNQPLPTDVVAFWRSAPNGLSLLVQKRLMVRPLGSVPVAEQVKALRRLAAL